MCVQLHGLPCWLRFAVIIIIIIIIIIGDIKYIYNKNLIYLNNYY